MVEGALFVETPRIASVPAIDHAPRPSRITLKRVALACLGTGAMLMSFVAYQLWGTALYEHHAQGLLLHELKTHGIVPKGRPEAATAPESATKPAAGVSDNVAPTIAAPALGQPVGLLSIPAIGMNSDAIVEGTGEAQLQQGPGHYTGTPLPGEAGNAAIAGHRTTYAAPFYNLNALTPGDLIYVQTSQGSFVYDVSNSEIVSPSDVSVLDSASSVPELTLTTCNPRYSSTQRLVVVANLQSSTLTAGATAAAAPPSSDKSQPQSTAGAGTPNGSTPLGEVGQAVLWGTLTLAIACGAIFASRRMWGLRSAAALVLGMPAALASLLLCFQHVSLALPQTF